MGREEDFFGWELRSRKKNIWCWKACFVAVGFVQDGRTSRIDFWELFWFFLDTIWMSFGVGCFIVDIFHSWTLRGVFHVPFQRFVGFSTRGSFEHFVQKQPQVIVCLANLKITSPAVGIPWIFGRKCPEHLRLKQPTQSRTRWIVRSNGCFPGSQGNEH